MVLSVARPPGLAEIRQSLQVVSGVTPVKESEENIDMTNFSCFVPLHTFDTLGVRLPSVNSNRQGLIRLR